MALFGLLGGVLGLAGNIIGGNAASKAAKRAGDLQYQAAQQGIAEQRRQYDLSRADYAPYLATGTQALGQQGDLIGLNGGGVQASAIEALRGSPFYQSLFNNGQEALLQNASATGGMRGGNMQRGLADFGADTLAQTIQMQLAQLGGLSGRGQEAVGNISQLGQMGTQNIMNMINGGAAAQARAGLARGGIQQGIWNNVGNLLSDEKTWQGILPGKWFA
jgi:hypothetical protein